MSVAAGIGPELILKALFKKELYDLCQPTVIGSSKVMEFYKERLDSPLEIKVVKTVDQAQYEYGNIDILDTNEVDISQFEIGRL